eukprot:COSAG05_NODE_4162_length_1646_cov_170.826761_1_plen_304_part_10
MLSSTLWDETPRHRCVFPFRTVPLSVRDGLLMADNTPEPEPEPMASSKTRRAPRKNARRRNSVSSEANRAAMASKLVVAEHPKAPEEVEAIRAVLKDNFLFAHLDAATVGKVAMAMFQVEYKAGDVIIRQGADGDNFYVVAAGTCKCYVGSCDEVGLVSICGAGDGYGELSLMYDAPRAASVIADTDVVLWALDRSSFTVLLMQSAMDKRSAHRDFLDSVDVLTRLSAYDKMTIADAVSPVNYQDGDRIIEEGAPGEFVAIVAEGQVAISMANFDPVLLLDALRGRPQALERSLRTFPKRPTRA